MPPSIQAIRGLKFPGEFVTRFFFKSGHDKNRGHVVELGCGNGNNLMLYQTYGWQTTGAEQLSITTPCTRASHLPQFTAHRTQRLIDICDHLGCDTYVSPAGAAGYLATDRFVDQTAIALDFANYQPPAYRQFGHDDFVSHLSFIDVVANLGWPGAAEYIRRPWFELPTDNLSPNPQAER